MEPTSLQKSTLYKFEKALQTSVVWVKTHQEQFWAILGTFFAAAVLIYFMVHRRQVENDEAWMQLGLAQGQLLQGQTDKASASLDQWSSRFSGSSAATYAKFLRADLLYNTSNYAGASGVYADLAQTAQPQDLRPLALSAQSASEEMAGRLPEATTAAQQFLDKYPDHYLGAAMFIAQARLAESSGNPAGASAIYDRFVVLYPQTPWTPFAKARLQALAGQTASPVKK